MTDWQVGDLAVCVDVDPQPGDFVPIPLELGKTYCVTGVVMFPRGSQDRCKTGLTLKEVTPLGERLGFLADRFRKIRPDAHEGEAHDWELILDSVKRRVAA